MRFPRQAEEILADQSLVNQPPPYEIVDGESVRGLDKGGNLVEILIIAAVVVALVGLGVFLFMKFRRSSDAPEAEAKAGEAVETEGAEEVPLKETPAES